MNATAIAQHLARRLNALAGFGPAPEQQCLRALAELSGWYANLTDAERAALPDGFRVQMALTLARLALQRIEQERPRV